MQLPQQKIITSARERFSQEDLVNFGDDPSIKRPDEEVGIAENIMMEENSSVYVGSKNQSTTARNDD